MRQKGVSYNVSISLENYKKRAVISIYLYIIVLHVYFTLKYKENFCSLKIFNFIFISILNSVKHYCKRIDYILTLSPDC